MKKKLEQEKIEEEDILKENDIINDNKTNKTSTSTINNLSSSYKINLPNT